MSLFSELRGLMKANDYTQEQLSRAIGMPRGTLTTRMSGRYPFTLDEAYRLLDFFRIPHNQLHLIFPPGGKAETGKNNAPVSSLPHVIRAKYLLKEIEELE